MTRPATAADIFGRDLSLSDDVPRDFRRIEEGRYSLTLEELGIQFDVSRLRRDRGELLGELRVQCDLAGARTFDGVLSVGDFNLSSIRARSDRAKYLSTRAQAPDLDCHGLLEELCQRVLSAERTGQPAVSLRDLPRPGPDEILDVDGFSLLARQLLAEKHAIKVDWCSTLPSAEAYAFATGTRKITVPPLKSEIEFAVCLHEIGHCLSERCSGGDHQRDPNVARWHHCIQCEVLAWQAAMRLLPFSFSERMHGELRRGLLTYRRGTPAPATATKALDWLASPLGLLEDIHKRRKFAWYEEQQRRARESLQRSRNRS